MLPYFVCSSSGRSGWLLVTYCPEPTAQLRIMWLIIALMAWSPRRPVLPAPDPGQEAGRDGHEEAAPVAEAAVAEESEDQ